jgi:hypothetical protein
MMQLADYFDVLLKDTVDLSRSSSTRSTAA